VGNVRVQLGSLDQVSDTFDLVMANIQADVLDVLAPDFPARLAPGAPLVLSGLLATDVDAVLRRYGGLGFALVERADDGEWASLTLRL
jgi:ribosomal protein L11 methyltransferase